MDLKKVVNKIKEDFGDVDIASDVHDPQDFISTGNKAVDLMLGGKGIPFGYLVEWAGLSGSGKTLMLQVMLANAQREFSAIGVWLDREGAFTLQRAAELNIDTDNLILAKPSAIPTVVEAEKFIVSTLSLLRDKYPDKYLFVAIDSLSAFGKTQLGEDMGRKAKALHSLFRQVLPLVDSRTSFHFANQVIFNPGIMFGDTKTTTGGEGPKYYTSFRLSLDDKKPIVDTSKGGEVIGNWINFFLAKTRHGPKARQVQIPFLYKEGFDY